MRRTLVFILFLALLSACGEQPTPRPTAASPEAGVSSPSAATVTSSPPATVTVSPPPSPVTTPTDLPPAEEANTHYFDSPAYGVQAFLWWRPDIAERDLDLVQEMGFGWVKQSFAWRDIETNGKGLYDWWKPDTIVDQVEAAGLKLVVRLDRQPFWSQADPDPPLENAPPADLQDFADFCGALAARYKGRIAAYQVWNEPNLSREWGNQPPDPVAYTELLKVCYEAIKVADPDAIVISAGLAPTGTTPPEAMPDTEFLQGMYKAGAGNYFDVLGVNAPGYGAPPEMSPEEGEAEYGHRSFVFRRVEDMRDIMVENGDEAKQVAILEMGWTLDEVHPEYAWFAVDEATQAEYLVRAYEYAREHWQPWIGLMTTIYIANYDWTPENEQWWWSIVLPDGTPRKAYHALKEMKKGGVEAGY